MTSSGQGIECIIPSLLRQNPELYRKVSLEAAGFLLSRKADDIRQQSMLIYLMFILRAVCKDKEHFYRPIKEVMNDEYMKFKRFTKASRRGIFYAPEMFIRYFFLQLATIDWRANFAIYLNEGRG